MGYVMRYLAILDLSARLAWLSFLMAGTESTLAQYYEMLKKWSAVAVQFIMVLPLMI